MSIQRTLRRALAASAVVGASLASFAAHAQLAPVGNDDLPLSKRILLVEPDLKYDPFSVLVKFSPRATAGERANALALVGGKVLKQYDLVPGLVHMEVSGKVEDAVIALGKLRGIVEYAEPDFVVRAGAVVPNDPSFGQLWGMSNTGQTVNADPGVAGADIRATDAWGVTTGDANFVVAIIDSGTQLDHPDLAANIWTNAGEIAGNGIDDDANGYVDDVRGWDFFSIDNDPTDGGHGTHTAGTVGAVGNNGIGVAGVAWNCKLMALRFLGPTGGFTSDAILAVQYVTRKNVKVSNNSWGGGGFSQALYDAIGASRTVGHVFVASAGNNGANSDTTPSYPAAYNLDNIISVAATDNNDARASFSNFGATSVDIGAPGVNTYSTYGATGYAFLNGTSMAGPHVAGVAALVYIQNPTWTYTQVRSRILSTSRPVPGLSGLCVTGGVLNAAAALGIMAPPVNTAPVVGITSPTAGSTFTAGTAVTFTGTAQDTQDGVLTASMTWSSSLQGQIGVGGSFTVTNLVVGSHVITARAVDSAGLATSVTRSITVANPVAPTIPSNLAVTRSGTTVTVSWRDRSTNETGFEVRRERNVGGLWGSEVVYSLAPNSTRLVQSAVPAGQYRYAVRAVNGPVGSAWTAWRTITVP